MASDFARLTADVERLRERPAPASAVVGGWGAGGGSGAESGDGAGGGGDRIELHSLGTGRRARGALAVGTAAAPGTAERYAVHSAVALLTLTTERSRSLHAAEQRIGAAVLRMLLAGEPDHARAVAGDLYGDLLDAPFRLVVAEPATGAPMAPMAPKVPGVPGATGADRADGEVLGRLADAVEAAVARAGEPVLMVPDGKRLVIVAVDGGVAVGACEEFALRGPGVRGGGTGGRGSGGGGTAEEDQLVAGLSGPAGPVGAATAYQQAEQALSVARRRGRALVEHDEVAAGSVLPLLADDAVRAFADGLLRALREHDATGRGNLVASLRAWLSRHGQWDAAAADLGVHRHTLRYRMRRVEEILGRSLDDPDVRMELWLALKASAGAGEA
ncbi:hypothetical protein GCM10017589_63890 [Streptomyces poonensis]|nr:hypothetical protein GCM10017589_63890 [Streptomyces poonensis]